jgi:hypothetical protein
VQSPAWADFDTIELYTNTATVPVPAKNFHGGMVPRYTVQPKVVLHAGSDFVVGHVTVNQDIGAERLEANIEIPLTVSRDAWVVVLVKGTDGVSHPLWPMNPQDLNQDTNQTLDELIDGNLGEGGVTALAFTNPLFIDVDGNGRFDAPGL